MRLPTYPPRDFWNKNLGGVVKMIRWWCVCVLLILFHSHTREEAEPHIIAEHQRDQANQIFSHLCARRGCHKEEDEEEGAIPNLTIGRFPISWNDIFLISEQLTLSLSNIFYHSDPWTNFLTCFSSLNYMHHSLLPRLFKCNHPFHSLCKPCASHHTHTHTCKIYGSVSDFSSSCALIFCWWWCGMMVCWHPCMLPCVIREIETWSHSLDIMWVCEEDPSYFLRWSKRQPISIIYWMHNKRKSNQPTTTTRSGVDREILISSSWWEFHFGKSIWIRDLPCQWKKFE